MARCTYCKTKWKVKEVWSILTKFEKIVHIASEAIFIKENSERYARTYKLTFTLLIPFLVDLSDEGPLDWYRKP